MTVTVTDPDEVAAALQRSIGLLLRRIRQLPDAGDLTLPESSALKRLELEGPTTSAELARGEQISPQSMGATVSALEARGLVERARDPHDGRRLVLSVSPAGAGVLRDKRGARTARLTSALADRFTAEERGQLMAASALVQRLAGEV